MPFEVFHPGLLGRTDVIAVDMIHAAGLWGPCFTHHPPHNNHPRYAADTSTAGVLRFLEECLDGYDTISLPSLHAYTITTHHFDADALLPVWALLHPEAALEFRDLLERIARCGDFFLLMDEESAKLNFTLEALPQRLRGAGLRGERRVDDALTRQCFDWALPRWGDLLADPERAREFWAEPMREMHADMDYLSAPGRITELWDRHTSLVETDHALDAHALNTLCRNDLLLIWRTDTPERRLDVRPALGWYELPSQPHRPRYDLTTPAACLNAAEVAAGHTPVWEYAPGPVRLHAPCTRLRQDAVLDTIKTWLDAAPEESVPRAYRADVRDVFRHLPHPAVQDSHRRFAAASELHYRPGAAYGDLHFLGQTGTVLWDDPVAGTVVLRAGAGKTPLSFAVSDDFYWNRREALPLELRVTYEDISTGRFQIEYDSWDSPYQPTPPITLTGDSKTHSVTFRLDGARFGNSQEGGGDCRLCRVPGTALTLRELTLRKPSC